MLKVYPDYYKDFKCIASDCRHNCCIGWEIDIDEDTDKYYREYKGNLAPRLQRDICRSTDTPHFILKEKERCPFLGSKNLCDIITEMGEDRLCQVCAEHPRFHNELPDRTESGLGMCCEEAARLILTRKAPTRFITEGECEISDEIILLRDRVIGILQNRDIPLNERFKNALQLANIALPHTDIKKWAQTFLSLERLDDTWTDILKALKENTPKDEELEAFKDYMKDRMHEYEQLGVYFIYRYTANAPDMFEAALRVSFCALATALIFTLGASVYIKERNFTTEDQIQLCRMFSCEIEYSDENLYILYDELS